MKPPRRMRQDRSVRCAERHRRRAGTRRIRGLTTQVRQHARPQTPLGAKRLVTRPAAGNIHIHRQPVGECPFMFRFARFAAVLAALTLATPVMAQFVTDEDLAVTPAQFKAAVSGRTVRTYSQELVNRVEYFDPGGKVYVWPARANLLIGTWKPCSQDLVAVDASGQEKPVKIASICRVLPNPDGGTQTWNSTWVIYGKQIVERAEGDIFSLSQRTEAPYGMGKRSVDFEGLQANIRKYTR
ncbi:MAG: hypothetical protein IOD00_15390 [Rhodobacter sp.]|nr:hypothetical protein [Rhodobacter sp.]